MTHPRPLDVGLVIQNAVRRDGQGRVMVELASELLRRGHEVTVYAHRVDEALGKQVAFVEIPRAPGPQIVDDVVMLLRSTRAIRRRQHDVACVLAHSALPKCPWVFNAQFSHQGWRASWRHAGRPTLRHRVHVAIAARLERFALRRADHLISSTPVLARELGDVAPPTSVVPNGVDLDEFTPFTPEERAAAREALGLAADDFVVGFLGDYMTPRKGLEPLVEAVAGGPADERLVVAARGDDARLGELVARLGIPDKVVVAGFAPPRQVMAAADAVAVPSLYEPFSLVAFEAAASGVPVAVSAVAGAAPLLGDSAVPITDPADAGQIRKALDVLHDPVERTRLVTAGRATVERFAWPAVAAEAADVVEECARTGKQRRG